MFNTVLSLLLRRWLRAVGLADKADKQSTVLTVAPDAMEKLKSEEMIRPDPEQYKAATKIPVVVVLDNIRSMNNVGSFFRTCDAFAVESIVLCGIAATPPNREIHKTALGAEETVRWSYAPDTAAAVAELAAGGCVPIAVEQTRGSTLLHDFLPVRGLRYALVFGNEVNGVDQRAIDLCAGSLEIPQAGVKHSLNVAVAGGVVLWHFYSHLRQATASNI